MILANATVCPCATCDRPATFGTGPVVERVRARVVAETRFWGREPVSGDSADAKQGLRRSNRPFWPSQGTSRSTREVAAGGFGRPA